MSRFVALAAGTGLAVVPILWTGLHPLVTSLAVLGTVGTAWVARHRVSSLRAATAIILVLQVAAAHRLGSPPAWWPVVAALLVFLFIDAMSSAGEESDGDPGSASPALRRLLVLGSAVVIVAALLESVVLANLGSGLLPTAAAIAAVSALVMSVGHLVRHRA